MSADNRGSNNGPLHAVIHWGDTAVHLKDFALKNTLPNLVKITKGQYRNIGVAKSVQSELYLHSVQSSKKVLAEGIKIKESKKTTIQTLEQKYALPISYQGWFELLSENGKAIRPLQSVQELARVAPQKCLVRESLKAYTAKDNGEMTLDKSKTLHSGEQLNLVGETLVPIQGGKGAGKKKILRCIDSKGETVYLPFEQKAMFSPIAGQSNISGVHNMKGLLEKFRLPIMVRLVHGIIPSKLEKNSFTGIFRLLNIYSDETAFVCPLKKEAKMVPISTREPLKLVTCQNIADLQEYEETKYYHQRSAKMINSYMNSIHVLVNPPDPSAFEKSKEETHKTLKQDSKEIITPTEPNRPVLPTSTEEDILFQEIDDIYQYVRDGGRPPPPRPRPSSFVASPSSPSSLTSNHLIHQGGSPTSPVPPSPNLLTMDGSQNDLRGDDNYWEEPIYDEIDKYKRKKELNLVSAGITVTVDVQNNTNEWDDEGDTGNLSGDNASVKVVSAPNTPTSANSPDTPTSPSPPTPNTPPPLLNTTPHNSTSNLLFRSVTRLSSEPVQNLRQMYKDIQTETSGSRPLSINASDPDNEDPNRIRYGSPRPIKSSPPPPIPPKKLELDTGSVRKSNPGSLEEIREIRGPNIDFKNSELHMNSPPGKAKPFGRRNSNTSLDTNISNVAMGPGGPGCNSVNVILGPNISPGATASVNTYNIKVASRPPGSASIMVKSPTATTSSGSTHVVYNRTPVNSGVVHKNRISITTPNPALKYVAVARVGDEGDRDDLNTRNNFDHPPSRISNVTKHIQSMYL